MLLSDLISLEYRSTKFGMKHTHLGKGIDALFCKFSIAVYITSVYLINPFLPTDTTDVVIPFSSLAIVLVGFLTSLAAYR